MLKHVSDGAIAELQLLVAAIQGPRLARDRNEGGPRVALVRRPRLTHAFVPGDVTRPEPPFVAPPNGSPGRHQLLGLRLLHVPLADRPQCRLCKRLAV